jgi:APA family basic amino acid/polyamine antiporter
MATKGRSENLRRSVGFIGLLAMFVGLNIGGALFALTTVAAGFSGPALPLAMLISSLPVLLALMPYVMLTSVLPTTSATYRYSQLFSPTLALITQFTLLVCILVGGQPLFALAFGKYLGALIPVNPVLVGVLVLTLFYLINLLGVRLTANLQSVLFFLLVSALLLYIVLGLPCVQWEHFDPLFPKGPGGVLAAAGLLFTFSAGGLFVIDVGGEVIQARKAFPIVLPLGMAIAVVLYELITVVTVGAVDGSALQGESLIAVAERFMPRAVLVYFIIGGALVACATTINIIFTIVSRGLMVVSREGLIPVALGRVSKRFGTPHWGLTVAYLVCVVALVSIPSLMFFGSMLNLGLVLCITAVVLSAFTFPRRYPSLFARTWAGRFPRLIKAVCVAIILLNAVIFAFFMYAIGKATLLFMGILATVSLYALSRRRVLGEIRERLQPTDAPEARGIYWLDPDEEAQENS